MADIRIELDPKELAKEVTNALATSRADLD